jgi:adhesin transport system outer membrane protein
MNFLVKCLGVTFLLAGCQTLDLKQVYKNLPLNHDRSPEEKSTPAEIVGEEVLGEISGQSDNDVSLVELIDTSLPSIDVEKGFSEAITAAVEADPSIAAMRSDLVSRKIGVEISEKSKDFNVSGTLLGGVEDISDEQAGLAAVLSANRMIYDGGLIDARLRSERLSVKSAQYDLDAQMNKRVVELASVWVDLERYTALKALIDDRLTILNPLIVKLEQVADAGVGDITQVSAAQRTVSTIRATQLEVSENLELATLRFTNAFGTIPNGVMYESDFIEELLPDSISGTIEQNAPALLSAYASYRASEAAVTAAEAKDSFSVGFQARAARPVGGSSADPEERIGLVLEKTIYDGKLIESEIRAARARVKTNLSNVRAVYREGSRQLKMAQQTIISMDSAILLARKNAKVTADEIVYLRKQLIIGGSTLDKVLSAEARLYDAESKEINFTAQKRKAQLTVLGALGLIATSLGLSSETIE